MGLTKTEQAQAKDRVDGVTQEYRMDTLEAEQLVVLLASQEPHVHWAATDRLLGHGKAAVEALVTGLTHADRKVRATCALLLDHVADGRCIEPLLYAMRHDRCEAVRRCAMHALVCDGCKECPLNTDVVGALIEAVQTDRSKEVRRRAVFYLSQQRPDPRVPPVLESLLATETDPTLRQRAQRALAGTSATLIPSAASPPCPPGPAH